MHTVHITFTVPLNHWCNEEAFASLNVYFCCHLGLSIRIKFRMEKKQKLSNLSQFMTVFMLEIISKRGRDDEIKNNFYVTSYSAGGIACCVTHFSVQNFYKLLRIHQPLRLHICIEPLKCSIAYIDHIFKLFKAVTLVCIYYKLRGHMQLF